MGGVWTLERRALVMIPDGVTLPPRTETYPQDKRGGYLGGTDQTTALGIHGTAAELPLLPGQMVSTLGREGDLHVEDRYIAAVHARLERVGNWIRVENVSTNRKNPIIFRHHETTEFYIQPGDEFRIGDIVFVALNDEMRLARPTMVEIFGAKQHRTVDDCLIAAAADPDRHIVLIGDDGSEQERLGQAIHAASPRRRHRCIPVAAAHKPGSADIQTISDARDGTLLITLPTKWTFDREYVAAAVAPDAKTRLIICAQSIGKVRRSFPASVDDNAKQFTIPSLGSRKDEIPALLDRWFIERRSALRFALLTPEIQRKLLAHRWKENLRELRAASRHLIVLAYYESERAAARDKNTTRGSSRAWREKLELPLPLVHPDANTQRPGAATPRKAK